MLWLQNLEDRERKHSVHKDHLHREHRYLRRRLEQLNAHNALSKRRSVSECSTSTVSSTNSSSSGSPSSISESGKIWVLTVACGKLGSRLTVRCSEGCVTSATGIDHYTNAVFGWLRDRCRPLRAIFNAKLVECV